MSVTEAPLDAISRDAGAYPTELLREGETGLCLFAAAFLGANDAVHFANAGMVTTCVDVDEDRLGVMVKMYPADWSFLLGDAWMFAERWRRIGAMFDVVSVDTFTGKDMELSLASLDLWCSLARRSVIVTTGRGRKHPAPDGWSASIMRRSSTASWLVLTRD